MRMSFLDWSSYLNISIKGLGVQSKRRHEEKKLMKMMYPGSSHIGGCPDTGYMNSRRASASSYGGSIASLMCHAT
jgi:hypothetical protein